jgi:hypothetical protein
VRGAGLQSLWANRSVHVVVVFLCAGMGRGSVSMGTSGGGQMC